MRSGWLLVGALALAACQVGTYEVQYEDAVAARQQEAIERGWVPEWLPEDTTDIHQIHDPATGARVLTATLATPDAIDQHCPIDADAPPGPFRETVAVRTTHPERPVVDVVVAGVVVEETLR